MLIPWPAFISYPFDRIKRLYDINVHGAFFTAREAARNMIPQGGGSIVLVASMSGSVRRLLFCPFIFPIIPTIPRLPRNAQS